MAPSLETSTKFPQQTSETISLFQAPTTVLISEEPTQEMRTRVPATPIRPEGKCSYHRVE